MAEDEHKNQEQPPAEIPKEIIPDEVTALEAETIAPENQPEPTQMEVHHHSHIHSKSKWKEYIFQFFMLFLAVFCGFLAEWKLEHTIEHMREETYLSSMTKDLKTDTANMHIVMHHRKSTIRYCDSLLATASLGNYNEHSSDLYYFARRIVGRFFFIVSDGTIDQLKNAGGFRLIRNQSIKDSIQSYITSYTSINQIQQIEESLLVEYRNKMDKVFDARIFESMKDSISVWVRPIGNPPLISTSVADVNGVLMNAHMANANRRSILRGLDELEKKAVILINLIEREYQLE